MNDDFVPRKWSQKINHVINEKKFLVVLFIVPRKGFLTFESVVDILMSDHSKESYCL